MSLTSSTRLVLGAICAALALPAAMAAEHTVTQKGKAFSTATLAVKLGDKVTFRNDDAVSHNVFSLTDPMSFDLGTYSTGQAKDVVFNKEGKFDIECAIHPEMKMSVVVTK
jgi:plastocyanin